MFVAQEVLVFITDNLLVLIALVGGTADTDEDVVGAGLVQHLIEETGLLDIVLLVDLLDLDNAKLVSNFNKVLPLRDLVDSLCKLKLLYGLLIIGIAKFITIHRHDVLEQITNGAIDNFLKGFIIDHIDLFEVVALVQLSLLSLRDICEAFDDLHQDQFINCLTSLEGTEAYLGPDFLKFVLDACGPQYLIDFILCYLGFLEKVLPFGQTQVLEFIAVVQLHLFPEVIELTKFFPFDYLVYELS